MIASSDARTGHDPALARTEAGYEIETLLGDVESYSILAHSRPRNQGRRNRAAGRRGCPASTNPVERR